MEKTLSSVDEHALVVVSEEEEEAAGAGAGGGVAVLDDRWAPLHSRVMSVLKDMKKTTEDIIHEEARIALDVETWSKMDDAVINHGCIGFVWFRSRIPSVWATNQIGRLQKMIDMVLPGANWDVIVNADGVGDFVLLLPPPPSDETRVMLGMAVQQFGAWVWDDAQQRRRPVPRCQG